MEKDTRRSRSGEKPGRGFCFAAGKGEAGGKAAGVCTGCAMTGECCDPEGYWWGEVRHPSAACGGTSPCRGGLGGLRRGRGAAAGWRIPLRRYVREGLPGFALYITGRFWGREAAGMGKFGIC